jgi:hypothetical protein
MDLLRPAPQLFVGNIQMKRGKLDGRGLRHGAPLIPNLNEKETKNERKN